MEGARTVLRYGCIQVAGIRDLGEARMLVRSGVHMLGFPFGLSVHAQDTSLDEGSAIVRSLPADVLPVLITYSVQPQEVLALAQGLGVRGVQLHGPASVRCIRDLRASRPDLLLLKSLIVGKSSTEELLASMSSLAPLVDGFLTDTFDPATGTEGATGKAHDWSISRFLACRSMRPLLLAGGLTPDNVARAVKEVSPFGVDAHTGLEGPDGRKDPGKVGRFVRNASTAFAELSSGTGVGL
jgi:phosphoribosylanthranilate isomerase